MKQYETYKCNTCGCEVEVQVTGTNAKLSCCGNEMEMITENLTAVNLLLPQQNTIKIKLHN